MFFSFLPNLKYRFSCRILWLRVAKTNNNPRVVASYFLDYVAEIAGWEEFLKYL